MVKRKGGAYHQFYFGFVFCFEANKKSGCESHVTKMVETVLFIETLSRNDFSDREDDGLSGK